MRRPTRGFSRPMLLLRQRHASIFSIAYRLRFRAPWRPARVKLQAVDAAGPNGSSRGKFTRVCGFEQTVSFSEIRLDSHRKTCDLWIRENTPLARRPFGRLTESFGPRSHLPRCFGRWLWEGHPFMLHFTCDLCGKELQPGDDHRYVVKIECFAP